jgi:hypothetical protein
LVLYLLILLLIIKAFGKKNVASRNESNRTIHMYSLCRNYCVSCQKKTYDTCSKGYLHTYYHSILVRMVGTEHFHRNKTVTGICIYHQLKYQLFQPF